MIGFFLNIMKLTLLLSHSFTKWESSCITPIYIIKTYHDLFSLSLFLSITQLEIYLFPHKIYSSWIYENVKKYLTNAPQIRLCYVEASVCWAKLTYWPQGDIVINKIFCTKNRGICIQALLGCAN